MPFSDWLCYCLGSAVAYKMAAASLRSRIDCEEDFVEQVDQLTKTIRLFALDFYAS